MCAQMIKDAIPEIEQQCLDACRQELKKEGCSCDCQKQQDVEVRFNFRDIERQVRDAFRRVFH